MSMGVLIGAPVSGVLSSFGGPKIPFLFAAILIFFDAIARFLLLPSAKASSSSSSQISISIAECNTNDLHSPSSSSSQTIFIVEEEQDQKRGHFQPSKEIEMEEIVDLEALNQDSISSQHNQKQEKRDEKVEISFDQHQNLKELAKSETQDIPFSLEIVDIDNDHHQQQEERKDFDEIENTIQVIERKTESAWEGLIKIAIDMPLWASFWAVFAGNLSISMVEVTASLYLTDTFGYSTLKVGLIYGFSPLVYMIAVQSMGRYSRTVSRCWKVFTLGLIAQGIGLLCSTYFPLIIWFFVFWAIVGIGNGLIDGSANPAIGNIAESQHTGFTGRVFGIRNACSNLGFTLGPMIYWLFGQAGYDLEITWIVFGVFCIVSAAPIVAVFLLTTKSLDPVSSSSSSSSSSLSSSSSSTSSTLCSTDQIIEPVSVFVSVESSKQTLEPLSLSPKCLDDDVAVDNQEM